jgi:hypothetical protein
MRAGRSVNLHLVIRNWLFGWYVIEYEQNGCDRAEYGAYLIERLSDELGKQLGRGFSSRSLEQYRKFYLTHKQIPQTLSAEFGAKIDTFPQMSLKEFKSVLDPQDCAYYPKITEDEISQQSADQLLWFHINPVEFDGFRIQSELWNPESEPEEDK